MGGMVVSRILSLRNPSSLKLPDEQFDRCSTETEVSSIQNEVHRI